MNALSDAEFWTDAVACLLELKRTRPLADAARAYVAARLANDAAEPKDWTHHAAELERTWHDLLEASGLAMPEVST